MSLIDNFDKIHQRWKNAFQIHHCAFEMRDHFFNQKIKEKKGGNIEKGNRS